MKKDCGMNAGDSVGFSVEYGGISTKNNGLLEVFQYSSSVRTAADDNIDAIKNILGRSVRLWSRL